MERASRFQEAMLAGGLAEHSMDEAGSTTGGKEEAEEEARRMRDSEIRPPSRLHPAAHGGLEPRAARAESGAPAPRRRQLPGSESPARTARRDSRPTRAGRGGAGPGRLSA